MTKKCTRCGAPTVVITTIRRGQKIKSDYCTNCFNEEPVEDAIQPEQPRIEIEDER